MQSILTHWQHCLHKDNQGEKISQHLDLQLLLNPSGSHKTWYPIAMSEIPIHHQGTLRPARIQMIYSARDKSPILCHPIRAIANRLLKLVKLCITADLFGAFIQAAGSCSDMARNTQGSKPTIFYSLSNSNYNFQDIVCQSLLPIVRN